MHYITPRKQARLHKNDKVHKRAYMSKWSKKAATEGLHEATPDSASLHQYILGQ